MKQVLALCLVPLLLAAGGDKTAKQAVPASAPATQGHIVHMPDAIAWGPAPPGLPSGAQAAVLEGDPAKEGFFAIRAKMPAGYRVLPHTHPAPERITVLTGTLYLGMGAKWDEPSLKAYPAGAYVSMPAGMQHFAHFRDDTTIQITSMGPWGITYINPADDPRQQKGKM